MTPEMFHVSSFLLGMSLTASSENLRQKVKCYIEEFDVLSDQPAAFIYQDYAHPANCVFYPKVDTGYHDNSL